VSAERTLEIHADVESDARTAEVITALRPMMSVACMSPEDAGAAIECRPLVATPIDPR
jgi:hypothetical protein